MSKGVHESNRGQGQRGGGREGGHVGSREDFDFYTQKSEPLEDWSRGIAIRCITLADGDNAGKSGSRQAV